MLLVKRVGSAVAGGGARWVSAALLALLAAAALLALSPGAGAQTNSGIFTPITTLSDPVGSLAPWSYFYVEARVQVGQQEICSGDAEKPGGEGICKDGRHDEAEILRVWGDNVPVTWEVAATDASGDPITCPVQPCIVEARGNFQTTRTDSNGRAWGVFRVLSEGSVTITASAAVQTHQTPAVATTDIEVGQTASTALSEPGRVWVVAPLEQRRTSGRFTVQALVTDANGGAMPDGTPVTWRAIGFSGAAELEAELWRSSAADQTTTNGVAEATFARVPTQASNNKVLVIASAGDASASVYFETDQAAATGEGATVGLQLERATGQERWQLLDPDDTPRVALTAALTDAAGEPVPDGRFVFWDGGGVPATAGQAVLSRNVEEPNPDPTFSTTTTSGGDPAGKAAYNNFKATAAGQGYVIARRGSSYTTTRTVVIFGQTIELPGETIQTRYDHPIDIAWFNVGEEYAALPEDLAFSLRLADDSDNMAAVGSTARLRGVLTFSGPGDGLDHALHVTGGTLRIAGDLEWEATGRNTYTAVPAVTARSRAALLREQMPLGQGFVGSSASDWATTGAECRGSGETGVTLWTCSIDLGNADIVIPAGAELGDFAISGTLNINGTEVKSEAYAVQVIDPATFEEVAALQFGFAEQTVVARRGQPYPSSIATGQSTRLRLKVLNEGGTASAPGTINTIFVTTSAGSLGTTIGSGCRNSGGLICQIPVASLTSANSDKIDVTITHPGGSAASSAELRVRLTKDNGEALTAGPITVMFLGSAESVGIAAPKSGVLNINAETTEGAEEAGSDRDHRDQLTLAVTAADENGMKVALPSGRSLARVLDPDGKLVSSGVTVEWPLGGADSPTLDGNRNEQVRINVNRAPTQPLANGEYTIELRAGSLTGRQTFMVAGPPAAVALSAPDGAPSVGDQLTVTATLTDANDARVPNGTPVEWSSTPTGAAVVLVELTRERTTTDGQATASYLVVTPGSVVVTAGANCGAQAAADTAAEDAPGAAAARTSQCAVSDVQLFTVPLANGATAPPPPLPGVAGDLGNRAIVGFNTWLGAEPISAAELVAELLGINSVLFWRSDGVWLRYNVIAGIPIPGATNFQIAPGSVIVLGN